jgi:6-phosphofructokinase 1
VKAVESLLEGKSNYMVGYKMILLYNTIGTSHKGKRNREVLRVSDIMST